MMPGAVKGASQHGDLVGVTRKAIKNREDFVTNGSLWGVNSTYSTGVPGAAAVHTREFVVYSYREPIAVWTEAEGWVLTTVKFSNTTGRHQSMVRAGIGYETKYDTINQRFGWTA
jgi:hypothetical protein